MKTITRHDVLAIIAMDGPMTVDTLSRFLGVSPQRTAGFVSSLYGRNKIRKNDQDEWEVIK